MAYIMPIMKSKNKPKIKTKSKPKPKDTVVDVIFSNTKAMDRRISTKSGDSSGLAVVIPIAADNDDREILKPQHNVISGDTFNQTNLDNMSLDEGVNRGGSLLFDSSDDDLQYKINMKQSLKIDKVIRNIILKNDFNSQKFIKIIMFIHCIEVFLYMMGVRMDPIKKHLVYSPKGTWYNFMRLVHNTSVFLITTSLLVYYLLYFVKNLNEKYITFDVNFQEFLLMSGLIFTTIYVIYNVKYTINISGNYAFDVYLIIETLIHKDDQQSARFSVNTNRIIMMTTLITPPYYCLCGYYLYNGFTSFIFVSLIIAVIIIFGSVIKYILMCKLIKFRVENLNKYLYDINFYFNDNEFNTDLEIIKNWYPRLYTSVKEFNKFNKTFIKMFITFNCYLIAYSLYLILIVEKHLIIHITIYIITILLTPLSVSMLMFGQNLSQKTQTLFEDYLMKWDSIEFIVDTQRVYSYIIARNIYLCHFHK
ncbi:uncharacterized protein LOC128964040 [Oppia nitens]|uniref:uncharacterized protein LOC128964040 n=1 Tax=Oppia nitens TaxID=1686743 RepID=UPI0023DA4AF7|nr:uncharacterized protein LOC128964040 [Oppia nitens]